MLLVAQNLVDKFSWCGRIPNFDFDTFFRAIQQSLFGFRRIPEDIVQFLFDFLRLSFANFNDVAYLRKQVGLRCRWSWLKGKRRTRRWLSKPTQATTFLNCFLCILNDRSCNLCSPGWCRRETTVLNRSETIVLNRSETTVLNRSETTVLNRAETTVLNRGKRSTRDNDRCGQQ